MCYIRAGWWPPPPCPDGAPFPEVSCVISEDTFDLDDIKTWTSLADVTWRVLRVAGDSLWDPCLRLGFWLASIRNVTLTVNGPDSSLTKKLLEMITGFSSTAVSSITAPGARRWPPANNTPEPFARLFCRFCSEYRLWDLEEMEEDVGVQAFTAFISALRQSPDT